MHLRWKAINVMTNVTANMAINISHANTHNKTMRTERLLVMTHSESDPRQTDAA